MSDFLSREETADRLEISTRTLDRYVRRKLLKPHRRGKRTMFLRADVEALASAPGPQTHVVGGGGAEHLPAEQHPQLEALISLAQEMHGEIRKKDQEIAHLSFELGKYQEIAKNSVPLLESRKQEVAKEEEIGELKRDLISARFGKQVFLSLFGLSCGALLVLVHYLFLQ